MSRETIPTKQLIKALRVHMIDNKLSFYTFHHPISRQAVEKRAKKDPELEKAVILLKLEHVSIFEKMALDNLGNKDFNSQLFRHLTRNKKAFLPYEVLELEERLSALEGKENE